MCTRDKLAAQQVCHVTHSRRPWHDSVLAPPPACTRHAQACKACRCRCCSRCCSQPCRGTRSQLRRRRSSCRKHALQLARPGWWRSRSCATRSRCRTCQSCAGASVHAWQAERHLERAATRVPGCALQVPQGRDRGYAAYVRSLTTPDVRDADEDGGEQGGGGEGEGAERD